MRFFAPCCEGLVCRGKFFGSSCQKRKGKMFHKSISNLNLTSLRLNSPSVSFILISFIILANGQWSTWGDYSTCTKSCGTGHETRTRACNNPSPSGGGEACPGLSSESRKCNTQDCPGKHLIIFIWSFPKCIVIFLSNNVQCSINFIISSIEHEVDCKWGPWGEWSSCSKTCGGGLKSLSREMNTPASGGGKPCVGGNTTYESCNMQNCGIDCVWGSWGEWSTCSKTCGWGVKSLSRKVARPASDGGKNCEGSGVKREACNVQACPDVTKSGSAFYFALQ